MDHEQDRRVRPDRRKIDVETEEFRTSVTSRLEEGEHRMDTMAASIDANTAATEAMRAELKNLREQQQSSAELLDFFNSVKGAFKVFDAIGKLAKPLGAIIALGVALGSAWKLWGTR